MASVAFELTGGASVFVFAVFVFVFVVRSFVFEPVGIDRAVVVRSVVFEAEVTSTHNTFVFVIRSVEEVCGIYLDEVVSFVVVVLDTNLRNASAEVGLRL